MDTMGFFETNTDLTKGLTLRNVLQKAGVGFIKMSRTKNGYVSEGDKNKTPNDQIETAPSNDGNQQVVTLSVICQDVESNNMDYFISIHSNAASEGSVTNYPLLLYRGTDDASGNGLVNAKAMAQDAWKYVAKNGVTYHSAYTAATSNNSRGDITFYGSSSTNGLGYTGYLGVIETRVRRFSERRLFSHLSARASAFAEQRLLSSGRRKIFTCHPRLVR